ncbi:MAG TPA: hypothetical protein VFF06_11615 [Polyangia bacterium]|nr:hypothetical protein [Polyangia bacterium]
MTRTLLSLLVFVVGCKDAHGQVHTLPDAPTAKLAPIAQTKCRREIDESSARCRSPVTCMVRDADRERGGLLTHQVARRGRNDLSLVHKVVGRNPCLPRSAARWGY